MKSRGVYKGQITIIVIFVVIILLATGFLLYINASSTLKSNLKGANEQLINAKSYSIANIIDKNLLDLNNIKDKEVVNKYMYVGSIDGDKIILNNVSYTCSSFVRQKLIEKQVNFYSQSQLTSTAINDDTICAVYSLTKDDKTVILVQDGAKFLNDYSGEGFEKFAVVAGNGKVLFSNDFSNSNVTDLSGAITAEIFSQKINTVDNIVIGNDTFIASTCLIKTSVGVDAYVIGFVNINDMAKVISSYNIKIIALLSVGVLALTLMYIALAVSMRNQYDFLKKYTIKTKNKYVIVVDDMGKIKQSNHDFKSNFFECNMFENMAFFEMGQPVADGDSIFVVVYSKKNEKRLLNFLVSKINGGFKLVGVDSTELFAKFSGRDEVKNLTEKELRAEFDKNQLNPRTLLGLFDITNIKNLDLMFGRAFSEKVFEIISQRIKQRFSRYYELSGSLIGVYVTDQKELDYTLKDMQLIIDSVSQAVLIDDNLVSVSIKAGFAISDDIMKDRSYEYVLKCAKAALKRSSKEERVQFYVYHESQKKLYSKLIEKDWDIKAMLQAESFVMEFQPQYSIKTKKPYGFEALFRIKRSLSVEVDIFELITYAERTGNMILLGEFIFNQGMEFAKSIEGSGVHVSLNVSPVQLMQAGFVESFLKIYRKYNLKPNSISIEITESFLMTTFDETLAKLQILQQNGIDIHLDDFGVSYSSLLYLKKLPISAIKIDREFIADIENNTYDKTITKTIIDITKQLGQICISEGVETQGQYEILNQLGCDVVQGYLTGKSMVAEEARKLV